jgi:hypothetical protein
MPAAKASAFTLFLLHISNENLFEGICGAPKQRPSQAI